MTELSPDDPSLSDTHDTVSKESLLLLCTENAIRLFSLSHAIQVFLVPNYLLEVLLLCEFLFLIVELPFREQRI